MKKLFSAAAAIVAAMCLTGCFAQMPDGYDAVKAAKSKYEALDSARAVMTDLNSGEQIMQFSFYINSRNEMILSYYGKDGDNEMFAYSDGAEYYYKENGAELWSVIGPGDENYIYNIYNREYRYPYADGGMFFLDGASVETAEMTTQSDGSCTVIYRYDVEKLNQSTEGLLDNVSSFSALTTTFEIDKDGFITEFIETGTVTDSEGVTMDINMSISIDMMNEVYEIPYPVDRVDKNG